MTDTGLKRDGGLVGGGSEGTQRGIHIAELQFSSDHLQTGPQSRGRAAPATLRPGLKVIGRKLKFCDENPALRSLMSNAVGFACLFVLFSKGPHSQEGGGGVVVVVLCRAPLFLTGQQGVSRFLQKPHRQQGGLRGPARCRY